MNICVVGTGYVGLVVGTCLADFGNHVICVDNDQPKINNLKNGILPIYEIGLTDLVLRNTQAGRLEFSTDLQGSLNQSLVLFIAVGTASAQDGSADLSAVLSVAADIGISHYGIQSYCHKEHRTGRYRRAYLGNHTTKPLSFDRFYGSIQPGISP